MPHGSTRKRQILILAVIGLAAVACVDERVVFRDRELFTEPPAGAANFIGYTDSETKLTVCGNCHINNQTEWEGTAHADAFATLVASGNAQASCEGCHAVSSRGNPASGQAGWDATRDERYHDVQCESCHGPGLTHVTNPQATNIPLAPLAVDTALTRGCGECHNGTHHPFVQEWRQSGHGRVQSSPAGRAECNICHTAENVLLSWGVRANYAEKDSVLANASAHLPIVCSVCHDPHATDHSGQLRFPIDAPNEEENLCMRCHHKRGTPDPTTFRGPHSPEGPILLGYGGWWPPSMEFPSDTIYATHGSDRNPRLCAGCHVYRFTVNDPATGNFAFQVTGHLFEAIPCLNAQGIPVPGDCALAQRTFRSCAGAGCHTEASAQSAYQTVQNRLQLLTDALADLIDQIPASEFNDKDGKYTTAEGSMFNLELADPDEFPGSGIHNPFLVEALVTSSIRQIEVDYGISAPAGLNLNNILQQRSGRK